MSGYRNLKGTMPLGMENSVRYDLDFRIIPGMVNDEFIREILTLRERFFRNFFNRHYQLTYPLFFPDAPPRFQDSDFSFTESASADGSHLIYVTLPEEHRGSFVYCTAYAFAFRQIGPEITDIRFFTVEHSDLGTGCIGTMAKGTTHLNLAPAADTAEGNKERIHKIAFGR